MNKRLYRDTKEGVFFGVCAGLGEYFNIDPVFIRIIWLLTLVTYGFGIIAYLFCCLLMPSKSK